MHFFVVDFHVADFYFGLNLTTLSSIRTTLVDSSKEGVAKSEKGCNILDFSFYYCCNID